MVPRLWVLVAVSAVLGHPTQSLPTELDHSLPSKTGLSSEVHTVPSVTTPAYCGEPTDDAVSSSERLTGRSIGDVLHAAFDAAKELAQILPQPALIKTSSSSTKTTSTKTTSTKTTSTKTTSTKTTSTKTTSTKTTSSKTSSTKTSSTKTSSTKTSSTKTSSTKTSSTKTSSTKTSSVQTSSAKTSSTALSSSSSALSSLSSATVSSSSSSSVSSSSSSSVSAKVAAPTCTNSATDRSCWGNYNISTNYYDIVPDTGVTREYWFNVENTTASPDGIERIVLAINGSIPGPTIIADWGDEIVVHVTNSMTNNGSTIHWHGIRQNYTNYMDGVPSVTQCPIAPGDTQTYRWRATQYGSSWYHSHWSVQAWDGIFGGILINGPATANYDVDLGHVFLNDWSHQTADVLALAAATTGPPTLDNCLINGTNTWTETDGTVVGSRFQTTFDAGTKYRIRLVNGAADTHFRFTIDNHTMEVISTDFVPITPYTATDLSIGMGQRYDIIVTGLTGTTSDFWMRAIPQEACSDNDNVDNILGIVRYDSSSTADPTTTAYTDIIDSCADEDASNLAPYLAIDVGAVVDTDTEEAGLGGTGTTIKWAMNSISFVSEWNYPSVKAIAEGNTSWTTDEHVWSLPTANEWVMMIIETDFGQAHPIHLHGHDFWVLGAGDGTYSNASTLQTVGAPRRDVAMLPGNGWVVLAWITDNPGAWLMHCHIAWHADEGFALQLIERESEINALQNNTYIDNTCNNWDAYTVADNIVQDDSGV